MRNEGPFIVEWVTWYRMLGFTDIVIVTNNCADRSPELLDALQAAGWVHHLRRNIAAGLSITPRKLIAAKRHPAVRSAQWLMVCDVDEFLVIHKGDGLIGDLIDTSDGDPAFLGMSINWKVFGTDGRATFEDTPVHQQFVHGCCVEHGSSRFVKSIFRKPRWFASLAEHGPQGLDLGRARQIWGAPGMVWVNSAGKLIDNWRPDGPYLRALSAARTTHKVAQINHYMLRSAESYSLKRLTRSPVSLRRRYTKWYFDRANSGDQIDASAFRHADSFADLFAQAMALPDVARLHQLCCADHIRLICEKAGTKPELDPRYQQHLEAAQTNPA